jgi:chromate reductase
MDPLHFQGRFVRILTLSGSLRAQSTNAALLRAASALAPPGMYCVAFDGLAGLPAFDPDLEKSGQLPPAVQAWMRALQSSSGLIISSPEYAHGMPGALKNALDWVVGSGELVDKPVLLFNAASAGGEKAQAALVQTLTVMNARVLVEASLLGPLLHQPMDDHGQISKPELAQALRQSLQALALAAKPA